MKSLGNNTFRTEEGRFYGRFTINGRRTFRRLASINLRAAREEIQHLQSEHNRSRMGLCTDPLTRTVTLGDLMDRWERAGCPDVRERRPRSGRALEIALRHLRVLRPVFGGMAPGAVRVQDCDRYHDLRIGAVREDRHQAGHRTVELELQTLSNVLTWSVRGGIIPVNPVRHDRPVYQSSRDVRHCTSAMVQTDEDFHRIADALFESRTPALGWQWFLEGLTGCRTCEILGLRWGAGRGEPGYMDDTSLWVHREKHGIFPYVLLDVTPGFSPLRDLVGALRVWHDREYPESPWWLPGDKPGEHLFPTALTLALTRISRRLGLGRLTSHGLRAWHVRVLRSLGVDDSEIAKRLGQRSGVRLVETTYGLPEPGWFGARRADFLPEGRVPAWAAWAPASGEAERVRFPGAVGM